MSKRNGIGDHPGALIFGGLLGGTAGAVATLLFTPWSGQRLREQLFGPAVNAVNPAAQRAGSVAQSVTQSVTEKGAGLAAPAVEIFSAAVQKGAEKGSAAMHGATTKLQHLTGGADEEPVPEPEKPEGKPLTTL